MEESRSRGSGSPGDIKDQSLNQENDIDDNEDQTEG